MAVSAYSENYTPSRTNRWQDWVALVVSVWFFFSPWILQFGHAAAGGQVVTAGGDVHRAAWDAWVLGAIIFFVTLSAIGRMRFSQEWVIAVLGIWVFIAPWVLGFAGPPLSAASWDHWIVGAIAFVCAVSGMVTARQGLPAPRAGE